MRWALFRAIATGLACFFPGSLFLTIPWANHHWAGEAQATLGAIYPSFIIGILSAIAGTIYLFRKALSLHEKSK